MFDPLWLLVFFLYLAGYSAKYGLFYDEYGKRPNFKEARQFKPKDKSARRNIRAANIGFAFFFCLGLAFLPFSKSVVEQMADAELMVTFFKTLELLIFYVNFMCRVFIYKEAGHKPPENSNSYYPIYDIFKKTGWVVAGKDWIVRVINISTAFGLMLFFYIIYLSWGG